MTPSERLTQSEQKSSFAESISPNCKLLYVSPERKVEEKKIPSHSRAQKRPEDWISVTDVKPRCFPLKLIPFRLRLLLRVDLGGAGEQLVPAHHSLA